MIVTRDELLQRVRALRSTEAEMKLRLVDPVAELCVVEEQLNRIHAQTPHDSHAAQATMANILFLRRAIRETVAGLSDVQKQIREMEDALSNGQSARADHQFDPAGWNNNSSPQSR
jgi:hypothetical protein